MTAMIEELKSIEDLSGLIKGLTAMAVWMVGVPLVLLMMGL
jgi:hypothetical protein